MTAFDWVGLWAALQVIGTFLGIALVVGVALLVLVMTFIVDPIRERRRRRGR